jgi:2-polyprenyl-3-methyl-5-hydroxy-6-metoxy-1,4-benzoquinol methylase
VIAVDIQPKMIERLKRRAAKAGLVERIDAPIARSDSDATQWAWEQRHFVLAFAMVHEMPDAASFFREAAETMKPGARMLLVEPSGHVSDEEFEAELQMARRAGLEVETWPTIRRSRTTVLRKSQVSSNGSGQS